VSLLEQVRGGFVSDGAVADEVDVRAAGEASDQEGASNAEMAGVTTADNVVYDRYEVAAGARALDAAGVIVNVSEHLPTAVMGSDVAPRQAGNHASEDV
jgi:hypothetical protein